MPGKKKAKPSSSKSQQRLMGMMYAYRKGKLDNLPDELKDKADKMKLKDLKVKASTKHKKLPERVEESKSYVLSFEKFLSKK